jgi:hypothetical protein
MRNWIRPATVIVAALIALRALTNVFKPLGAGTGLVFFGKLLHGVPNLILAPALGIYMLIYAYGMYDRRQYALPMGVLYTIFVVFNVCLFPVFESLPPGWGLGAYAVFGIVSIGGAAFAAWLLWVQRDDLLA